MKLVVKDIVNPIALRKAKIVYKFGLSECNRVNSARTHELKYANSLRSYFAVQKLHLVFGKKW